MWGLSYWVFPLFAALVWLAMLLGMLLTWITNGKPHLASMDDTQNIAYVKIAPLSIYKTKPLSNNSQLHLGRWSHKPETLVHRYERCNRGRI